MRDAYMLDEEYLDESGQLQTLTEVSRVLASTLELRTLYDAIYEQVSRLMDTTLFFIALHRPERSVIDVPYMRETGTLLADVELPYGNTVTSLVIDRGSPVRFNTHAEYAAFAREQRLGTLSAGDHEAASMVFVPLNTGNRSIGTLSAQSLRPYAYSDGDAALLSVIAAQAAVAIENARLYEQSQRNVHQTQALLNVARLINSSLDLRRVLDSILEGMREVMPYYLAAILLPDHAKGVLDVVASIGPLAEERRREMKIPIGSGITGTVFLTGEALNVPDVTQFDNYFEHGIREVQSEMAVPLKRGNTVIGVLDVEREWKDAFSPRDIDLMMLFASQAAIAIENARLYTEQQSRVFELQVVQTVVQKLTPLHDVPSIAAVVNVEIRRLIDFQSCRLFLLDEQGVLAPLLYPGADLDCGKTSHSEALSGWIAERGEPLLVPNIVEDPRAARIPGAAPVPESFMGVPLIYQGSARGVLALSRLPEPGTGSLSPFDDYSLRLLEILGAQVAIALDRAQVYEQLRKEAITDPVTKLFNRRYLVERFREERSRALRARHDLAVIMIDIDRFKSVNDTYGHDAGDIVLQELARLIRKIVRTEDLAARYGGEEFCVLLPEINIAAASRVAERLRAAIEQHTLPAEAGACSVTASIGLASLLPADQSTEIFTRADHAMYHVKRLGGNRVHVAGES